MRVKLNAMMFLIIIFLKKNSPLNAAIIMTFNAIIRKKNLYFYLMEFHTHNLFIKA
jgi:hypothetical protein